MESKAVFLLVLGALGVAAPLPEFIGGLVFCMVAAYLMFYFKPPDDKKTLWGTLALALIAGLLTANIHRSIFPAWDLRLMMASGGALSRFAVAGVFAFGTAAVERIGKIPESIKLPWEK